MDNIIFLNQHLKKLVYKKKEGQWLNGTYQENKSEEKEIEGVLMPVSWKTIKNYPEGFVKLEDKKLITKENFDVSNIIVLNETEYIISDKKEYLEISEIKFYLLRKKI